MNRWTTQFYVLVALVLVIAISVFTAQHMFIQDRALINTGSVAQTNHQRKGIFVNGQFTPESIEKALLNIQHQQEKDPALLHGLPLDDPNKFQNQSSIGALQRSTKRGET